MNPRYSEHKPNVVKLPTSYMAPKKKLSHTTKYRAWLRRLWSGR